MRRDGPNVELIATAGSIENDVRSLAGQFETLRVEDSRRLDSLAEYAKAEGCRAVFLRRYFGEEDEDKCGLCDDCGGVPERNKSFFAPLAAPRKKTRGKKKSQTTQKRKSRPRRRRKKKPTN